MVSSYSGHKVTRSGLVLRFECGGSADAPTVILSHGGGQTRHSWRGVVRQLLQAGYKIVWYDARGHGESQWAADGDYRIEAFAADLIDMARDFGPRFALVGASLGGMTAFYAEGVSTQAFAEAIVMVDIVLNPAAEGIERIHNFMRSSPDGFATLEEAAAVVASYASSRPRTRRGGGLLRNLRQGEDGRYRWHWDPRFLDATGVEQAAAFTAALTHVSQNVSIPTLLIRGMQSDIVDGNGVADMLKLVPHLQVSELPTAGHMVVGDSSDAFATGILNFLRVNFPL